MVSVFGPLRIISALRTYLFIKSRCTSFITARIASTLLITETNKGSISVRCRYTLKTSKVGIRPLGPTKSLTAFTAIYRIISLSTCSSLSSLRMISYERRKGT